MADTNEFVLREAALRDVDVLWRWRSDPAVYKWARSAAPVRFAEHQAWFAAALSDPTRQIMIAEANEGPVGVVRIDESLDRPGWAEISVTVDPKSWGKGIAIVAINRSIAMWRKRRGGPILATIHKDNIASVSVFERAGFKLTVDDHSVWREYVRNADQPAGSLA